MQRLEEWMQLPKFLLWLSIVFYHHESWKELSGSLWITLDTREKIQKNEF